MDLQYLFEYLPSILWGLYQGAELLGHLTGSYIHLIL